MGKKIGKKHTGVFGKTQSGKSYFFYNILFNKPKSKIILFNPKNDKTIKKLFLKKDYGRVKWIENLNSQSINLKKYDKIIYTRNRQFTTQDEYIDNVCKIIDKYFSAKVPVRFEFDEMSKFSTKHKIKETINDVFTLGLGHQKYGIWNTQRPQHIHNDIITQTDDFFIFNISENDYYFLQEFGYVPQDDKGLKWIKKQYHYIYYDGLNYYLQKPI